MISSFMLDYCATFATLYVYGVCVESAIFNGVGHFGAKFYVRGLRFALKSIRE